MEEIIQALSNTMHLKKSQIQAVLDLLQEGATIPFIARYRKEMTGNLDEDQIKTIEEQYTYQENLFKRKQDVIRLIEEKEMMNDLLRQKIMAAQKLTEVEDLYRPYKEKKKTKASAAIAAGLEPIAKQIMAFPVRGTLENLGTSEELEGAGYIIAEWISDNASYRKYVRNYIFHHGSMQTKIKKDAEDEQKIYEMYYEYEESIRNIKHHRILAIDRGEKEKVLTVSIAYDNDAVQNFLEARIIKNPDSYVCDFVKNCIKDALKRLILPSIKREIRKELSETAQEKAIETFKTNLEHLLLTRPIRHTRVLGFDPAFRTGCKLAVLDENGTMLEIAVIYPTAPHNDFEKSKKKMEELIRKYDIRLIAIGNGTASRESEAFVAKVIQNMPNVQYAIVSEAGASVYSASPLAKEEFPDLTVEKRSAISIGRRIQDPLSELVKIDPKSIGVGEYQHDVNQKQLTNALDFTTQKVVNEVGVNVNTASKSILKYISGLTKTTIEKIYTYKSENQIQSREEIQKIKGISSKVYEQCIGFLRIPDSKNPLDNTGIHPESYPLCNELLTFLNLDIQNMNTKEFKQTLQSQSSEYLAKKLNTDIYTMTDIIKELANPGLDPRDQLEAPILKSDILKIEDLKPGMELQGTVRNVASFGAFIDIGLHDDGLVHISKMSHKFVSDPNEIVHVGDIVTCYVLNVDIKKNRIQLSLVK